MKATLFWVLRHLLLPVAFVFATGLPQWLAHNPSALKEEINYYGFTDEELKTCAITPDTYFEFRDSIIKNRTELGKHEAYTPQLYFHDLKQIEMFHTLYFDSLNNQDPSYRGRFLLSDLQPGFVGALLNITSQEREYLKKGDINEEFNKQFPAEALRREQSSAELRKLNLKLIFLGWLFRFYLRGLFPALILFLIWRFKLKRDFIYEGLKEKVGTTGPLSFLLSLLLWPIVLAIDIRNRVSESVFRAEVVSRRSKMLSVFSKQDEALLQLGKKMTLQEFREHLDSTGMVRRHSFAAALMVTMFLMLVPRCLFPQTDTLVIKDKVVCVKVDYGGGGNTYQQNDVLRIACEAVVPENMNLPNPIIGRAMHMLIQPFLYRSDFVPDIGKVPLVNM